MKLGIRYQLRRIPPKKVIASLTCRIRCGGGHEDPGFVVVDREGYTYQFEVVNGEVVGWDHKRRRPSDPLHEAFLTLPRLEADITDIYERQHRAFKLQLGPAPTAKSIRVAYLTGTDPQHQDNEWYYGELPMAARINADTPITAALVDHLTRLPGSLSPVTLSRWHRTVKYLGDFVAHTRLDTAVGQIRPKWVRAFHAHVMNRKPDKKGQKPSADEATRHVRRLSDVMDYLVEEEVIDLNPIKPMGLPRAKVKGIEFLEQHHLDRLASLHHLSPIQERVRWWFTLMVYTGMDYPDAKRFVESPDTYLTTGRAGSKLVNVRLKTGIGFTVPVTEKLTTLLTQTPPEPPHPKSMNDYLKGLGEAVGLSFPLTVKHARKTAGAYFLYCGYTIEAVSRILGHDEVKTTQRHYVSITGNIVDRDSLRLAERT